MKRLTRIIRRFKRDTEGSYSVETILLLPMLAWAILAMYSYFDGLRLANVNVKAAHTIGDILSRENAPINDAYIDGTAALFDFLINRSYDKSIRISAFQYDRDADVFTLLWSEGRGSQLGYTQASAGNAIARLPTTADGDTVIAVETWMNYRSAFVMGLTDTTLYNFLVTSPRFAPQLLWENAAPPSS